MNELFLLHAVWFVYMRGCKQIVCVPAQCVLLLAPLILRENNNIVSFTIKYSIPGCGT